MFGAMDTELYATLLQRERNQVILPRAERRHNQLCELAAERARTTGRMPERRSGRALGAGTAVWRRLLTRGERQAEAS